MVYREGGGGPCIGLFTVWYILPVKYNIYTNTQISQNFKKKASLQLSLPFHVLRSFPAPLPKRSLPLF